MVIALELTCSASATWEIEGTDLFGRTYFGELVLYDVSADISLTFEGDDGITLFDNTFARFEEAGSEADSQIVILQDYEMLKGGQLSLVGNNILSTQIEIGTQPQLSEISLIVWNGLTGFQSAGNATGITRTNVSVPEPGPLLSLILGLGALAAPFAIR
jgi:hypothetical protein